MTPPHAPVLPDISAAVGNTPLVRLDRLCGPGREVVAKIESMNPGGSTKDRPALAMLDAALASGALAPGGTVVESSSGNLGMALARGCALRGVRFICVADIRANPAALAVMRAFGAEISLVSEPDPRTGDLLTARVQRVHDLLAELDGAISLDQYANPANPQAHADGTVREIAEALNHDIDLIAVACSTTGTLGGCRTYLREHQMDTQLLAVDAKGSVLFGGTAGPRRLPGMGAGFVTPLSTQVTPDRVERVTERDCVAGARLLARTEGILVGASTGGVIAALARVLPEHPELHRVAMLVHDGGLPYLPTVFDDDWVQENLGATAEDIETDMRSMAAALR